MHPSRASLDHQISHQIQRTFRENDIVITTYSMMHRIEFLRDYVWDSVIADEAQSIKNPHALNTRILKSLKSRCKFALTGTPLESHATDLWSIADFCLPNILGTLNDFQKFYQNLCNTNNFSALKKIIDPIFLRRLKTDKKIISDLPHKIEMKVFSGLTKIQADLYQQDLKNLSLELDACDKDIHRKGLILKYLMRFKQICNHPSQRLNDNIYDYNESGKFLRLRKLVSQIKERGEKFIVFTQFRELTDILLSFLSDITGQQGLVLHGSIPVVERQRLVNLFQSDAQCGFFILSLKAGGSGLNLTRATQVIHFDRWWNPAVENQATDRCFRIGQHHQVMVHKFICRGTIEDRIDSLIENKKSLADELVSASSDVKLTELSDDRLLTMMKLDTQIDPSENE